MVPLLDGGDDVGMVLSPQTFHNINRHTDIFNHFNVQFWEYAQHGYDAIGFISCTGPPSRAALCGQRVSTCLHGHSRACKCAVEVVALRQWRHRARRCWSACACPLTARLVHSALSAGQHGVMLTMHLRSRHACSGLAASHKALWVPLED